MCSILLDRTARTYHVVFPFLIFLNVIPLLCKLLLDIHDIRVGISKLIQYTHCLKNGFSFLYKLPYYFAALWEGQGRTQVGTSQKKMSFPNIMTHSILIHIEKSVAIDQYLKISNVPQFRIKISYAFTLLVNRCSNW